MDRRTPRVMRRCWWSSDSDERVAKLKFREPTSASRSRRKHDWSPRSYAASLMPRPGASSRAKSSANACARYEWLEDTGKPLATALEDEVSIRRTSREAIARSWGFETMRAAEWIPGLTLVLTNLGLLRRIGGPDRRRLLLRGRIENDRDVLALRRFIREDMVRSLLILGAVGFSLVGGVAGLILEVPALQSMMVGVLTFAMGIPLLVAEARVRGTIRDSRDRAREPFPHHAATHRLGHEASTGLGKPARERGGTQHCPESSSWRPQSPGAASSRCPTRAFEACREAAALDLGDGSLLHVLGRRPARSSVGDRR